MKKGFIYLIGGLLIFSLLLTGCNAFAETQPKIAEETPVETSDITSVVSPLSMESNFDESKFPFDVRSAMLYFGNYNGVYVLDILSPSTLTVVVNETVDEYYFAYRLCDKLDVYNANDGKYYTLTEAYDKGLLPLEVIRYVYEKYVMLHPSRYKLTDNDPVGTTRDDGFYYIDGVCTEIKAGVSDTVTDRYWAKTDAVSVGLLASSQVETPAETPAETPSETLPYEEDGDFVTTSDAMDYEIKCAILKEWSSANLTPDDVNIPYFYGEFNGVYALGFGLGGICAFECQRIGEYEFIYSGGGVKRDVYNSKDGEFYTLKEAYDQGFLTIEDIGVIHEKFVRINAHAYEFDENGKVIPNQMPEIIIDSDGNVYVNGENTGIKLDTEFVEGEDGYWYINGENTGIKAESSTN